MSAPDIKCIDSTGLSTRQLASLRRLFTAAWSGAHEFTEADWENAFGGVHFIVERKKEILSHASIVERSLQTGDRSLRTGYVEAVATLPTERGRGYASALMGAVNDHIDETFALGALDTGKPAFYERFGWEVWRGATSVRTPQGLLRTPEEDGLVLVRLTPATAGLDPDAPISCEWRPGDVW